MAIVGHFSNLSEAQKLVQSTLLAGIVQEIYEEGQLLNLLPVMTIDSKSIIYNRESTLPSAAFYDIHEQIPWTADVSYATQVEVELKRVARQDVLDQFMMDTYKTPNDYRQIILNELRKGVMRTIENKFIYGSSSTSAKEYDGLNVLCAPTAGGDFVGEQNLDAGGASHALMAAELLQLIDTCKPKPDILLMTRTMRNTITAWCWGKSGAIVYASTLDQIGRRIEVIDGVRIVVSDYLSENEADNTGVESSATGLSSIYAIRFGSVEDGGLTLCTGGDTGGVNFFKVTNLAALEDFDAEGLRLTAYLALALGSTKAIARVHSIDSDRAIDTAD